MATESSAPPGALAYSRAVYSSMMDWHRIADTKGQLLLTLNGLYITVLSSIAIASSQEIFKRKASLPTTTWVFLAAAAAAAAATAISILSAIVCLHSRLSNARLDNLRNFLTERDAHGEVRYRSAAMYWFGTIARLDRASG